MPPPCSRAWSSSARRIAAPTPRPRAAGAVAIPHAPAGRLGDDAADPEHPAAAADDVMPAARVVVAGPHRGLRPQFGAQDLEAQRADVLGRDAANAGQESSRGTARPTARGPAR